MAHGSFESNGHQVTDKNKMPPASGGFVVENFAFLEGENDY